MSLCRCGHFCDVLSYTHSATIRVNDSSLSQWLVLLAGKVTHCILRLYIPYQFMPLSTMVGIAEHIFEQHLTLPHVIVALLYIAALQPYRGDNW